MSAKYKPAWPCQLNVNPALKLALSGLRELLIGIDPVL